MKQSPEAERTNAKTKLIGNLITLSRLLPVLKGTLQRYSDKTGVDLKDEINKFAELSEKIDETHQAVIKNGSQDTISQKDFHQLIDNISEIDSLFKEIKVELQRPQGGNRSAEPLLTEEQLSDMKFSERFDEGLKELKKAKQTIESVPLLKHKSGKKNLLEEENEEKSILPKAMKEQTYLKSPSKPKK